LRLIEKNTRKIKCARCGQQPEWLKGKTRKYCPECHFLAFGETNCTHIKGRWAGVPFRFTPWQINDVIIPAFGTLKEDGRRQYRFIYVEIPKKNGKTELAAVMALYCLVADGEEGGEVYSAAGDRDQAALVYGPAAQMVRNKKSLSKRLKVLDSRRRIIDHKSNSFYQVLSADAYTKHGLNPNAITIDETHAHKNRELYETLTEGTDLAREQQLIIITTTAGIRDETSIGWELHEYARQVKEGVIEDPTFLPVMYAAKDDDDWEDRKVWRRCNPSLGQIFDIEKLEENYFKAKSNQAKQNTFRRFHLNQWVSQVSRYIPMDAWRKCAGDVDIGKLLRRTCYGGLDLSSKVDMTAFVLVFPPWKKNGKWIVLPTFYMPEDNIVERSKTDKLPYDMWARAGLIKTTPGNVIDYEFVQKDVVNASKIYNLQEVAFDPWNATETAVKLQNQYNINMVEHRQGLQSMSEPTKKLHAAIVSGDLLHPDHQILNWNADNLEVKQDISENVRPVKSKDTKKRIDGIVATIMAYGRAITHKGPFISVYKRRGLLSLEV